MFKVIPSLSISGGEIVLLKKGDFSNQLKYHFNIVDAAKMFEDIGVDVLHFLDLDGVKKGSPVNYYTLETFVGHSNLKVDFMGGIRTDGDINKVLEYGATYFTASSIAVNNHDLFASWIISYGREKLSLMANVADNRLVYKAWQRKADIDLEEHIEFFHMRGLKYLKVTDMNRDGVLEGPNFELYKKLRDKFPDIYLVASGGVRSVNDIRKLKEMGLYGVIVARALYEGKIKIEDLKEFAN
ncbi:MAG: 1-(5-phosphoribosyl)-5-[(5-phosphoribosylamino)methylideneamino] imidazole-4-carboxamide isomerase [Cyclobacteriaceae bacterium]|nr:1-(5-phosphoribosyl)-5-[(5-phosphoribosylamino)methylideneamino] imidazole-4-carboxamide isomerase [Cyclobacteriaceae bacterium]